ncbi:hypothetical protein PHYC_02038 [Phycisphaerales bacterium]|nr:hypothetical protein PHYC_02038 [Phycisphaerales bacterium]
MKLPFAGRRRNTVSELGDDQAARNRIARLLLRRYESRLERLHREEAGLREQLMGTLGDAEPKFAWSVLRKYQEVVRERRLLTGLLPHPVKPVSSFAFSSWLLRDSFRICTATPDEGMHFVVGVEIDGIVVGTSIQEFAYAERSPVRAAGVHRATHALTIDAAESGHRIVGILHSHPGYGPHANHASGTDLTTHRLWEQTAPLVGGIWSRSGHLRFFTAGRHAAVSVAGTHLEQIDEHNWKLRDEFVGGRV